jgi:hypothetical protein
VLERIESLLTILFSLIGAVSAVMSTIVQIRMWLQAPEQEASIADLEKDIVRLETALQRQQIEIKQLREAQNN